MSMLNNSLLLGADAGAAGYEISRSLRFNSSDSAFCGRSFASAGTRTTWTLSMWLKRSALGSYQHLFVASDFSSTTTLAILNSDDTIEFYDYQSGAYSTRLVTTQVFRDASAWYHLLFAWDTTNATSTDRMRVYVNGNRIATFSTATYPGSGVQSRWNNSVDHRIGNGNNTQYLNGYLADIHFIDGQALTPSSFTEVSATTGQLIPKAYTGSFGTNGFWLKFSDNSAATATTLGKDYSGNNNNWTPNNLSVTAGAGNDSLVDTPTSAGTDTGLGGQVTGNYCTLNPLTSSGGTYSQGNLRFVGPTNYRRSNGTIAVSTGKWYWEVTLANGPYSPRTSTSQWNAFGFGLSSVSHSGVGSNAVTDAVVLQDNGYSKNFSDSVADVGTAFSSGDVLSCAVDLDANTFTFRRNNTQVATGTIGGTAGRELVPIIISYNDQYGVMDCNFGARPFAYQAPSGFKALCDTNLPAPVVAKPSEVMDILLWSGNNASPRSLSGLNFSPDFAWLKVRSDAAGHSLFDTVRGTGKTLETNVTSAEVTNSQFGYISAFDSAGFTVTAGTYPGFESGSVNMTGRTYVGWCWDAGTSTVTNTQGSITSQVRANASAGFSIVTYTGTGVDGNIGHGLNAVPKLIIIKARNSAVDWLVYTTVVDGTLDFLILNKTDAKGNALDPLPTSSVFEVGAGTLNNASGSTYVAYCFAPVAGYSSMGSYVGNGSSDGTFVYTGFRPRFVLIKRTDSTSQWAIKDSTRDTYNVATQTLLPNLSNAEETNRNVDLLSNGFKWRGTDQDSNVNGGTFIYLAIAESPFQYARAR